MKKTLFFAAFAFLSSYAHSESPVHSVGFSLGQGTQEWSGKRVHKHDADSSKYTIEYSYEIYPELFMSVGTTKFGSVAGQRQIGQQTRGYEGELKGNLLGVHFEPQLSDKLHAIIGLSFFDWKLNFRDERFSGEELFDGTDSLIRLGLSFKVSEKFSIQSFFEIDETGYSEKESITTSLPDGTLITTTDESGTKNELSSFNLGVKYRF